MRDFKVKLISPPLLYFQMTLNRFFLPYGLGVLSAFLKNNNYNAILDDFSEKIENNNKKFWFSPNSRISLNVLQSEEEIIDYIHGRSCNREIPRFAEKAAQIACPEKYDLIGISIMTYYHFLFAQALSKKIKATNQAKVVLGGPFITMYAKELFGEFRHADYMIVGDGQVPLLKLIEHLEGRIPIEKVPNLLYIQKDGIKENSKEFFPIDEMSIPDFSDLPLDYYRNKTDGNSLSLPYQIIRGCKYNCSFCKHKMITPFIESKSYDKVVRELKTMKLRYRNDFFFFCDEAVNYSYEYLEQLCDTFVKNDLGISWEGFATADNLDKNILRKMKNSGCKYLRFGIESGSNRIIKNMGKGFNIEQASEILKNAYQEGIKNLVLLMVGFPHEKEEDIIKTIEFIKKNSEYIDKVGVTPLRVEYGTLLYNNPEKFGIENLRPLSDIPSRRQVKYFAFDETGGLRWEDNLRQQEYFRKRVLKTGFKYILSKKYKFSFIPFSFYFWLTESLCLSHDNWVSYLLGRLFPWLHRRKKER